MSTFVIGDYVQVLVTEDQRALGTNENFVEGFTETGLVHGIQVAPCCQQRCLVDEIRQISTDHAWCATSNGDQVNVLAQWYVAAMNLEDRQATIPVGALHCHSAVETSWAEQGFVQAIRPVCC